MSAAIYVGHEAELAFLIRDSSGAPLNLLTLGVTRVVLALAGVVVDSAQSSSAFDWESGGSGGTVRIDLTGISFPAGSFGARLVIYYPAKPLGVVVADGYPVNIGKAIF